MADAVNAFNSERRALMATSLAIIIFHVAGDRLSLKTHGRYVWILWRYYQGCIPAKGGRYLGETDF